MKMRPVGPLPIEPGKPVTLAPGGYHIMLSGLKRSLKQGDSFPITLSFAKAGPVTATADIVAKAGGHDVEHGPRQHGCHADARRREAALMAMSQ